jgi:hypothetical protein
MNLELGERSFMQAFARYYGLAKVSDSAKVAQLLWNNFVGDNPQTENIKLLRSLSTSDSSDAYFALAKHILLFRYFESIGKLDDALSEAEEALKLELLFPNKGRRPERTCLDILARYAKYLAIAFKRDELRPSH